MNRRTPLTRKVGLKPGKPMARKAKMKTKRPKYPTVKQEKARIAWAEQFTNCMVCGSTLTERGSGYASTAKEVHHISPRSHSPGKFEHPSNWLATCRGCHETIHQDTLIQGNAFAALLACKLIYDPECFDLTDWLALAAGDGNERVTVTEIAAAHDMHMLLRGEFVKRLRNSYS